MMKRGLYQKWKDGLNQMLRECNMSNTNSKLYISDQLESSDQDMEQGGVQVLIADDKEKVASFEKSGNQSSKYYKK